MSEMDNRISADAVTEQMPEENTTDEILGEVPVKADSALPEASNPEISAETETAAFSERPADSLAEAEKSDAGQNLADMSMQDAAGDEADSSAAEQQETVSSEPESADSPEEQSQETAAETAEDKPADDLAASGQNEQNVLPLDIGRGEAILEGLLYIVGDDGLTAEQAADTMGIAADRARDLFELLQKKYSDDSFGIEIANYGGIYRFLSKAFVHEYAKKLFQLGKESALSQAALETLAIVAYKQPITRVEIEEIRGVGADMMLRKLMARDLIRESGRSEAPGRPILYEVTEEFMDSFKLLSLSELPELPKFGDDNLESDDLFQQ